MKRYLPAVLLSLAGTAQAQDYSDKSEAELARELANPNTPLTSLKFKFQYRTYTGDLAQAGDQHSTTILFQPTLPFPMDNGKTLYVRPGVPVMLSQPTLETGGYLQPGVPLTNDLNGGLLDFGSDDGLGDISIDVQYGDTEDSGFLWSYGASVSMPTATEDTLGSDRWTAGPGFQLGIISQQYVFGGFLNHQWDFAGSGDADISLSTLQMFAVWLPGGGWSVASSPIMIYDHESNTQTVPLNFAVGKTVKLNGRPWKFAVEVNYYVKQADAFGPEWMVGVNVAPVVKNMLAKWFR